MSPPFPPALWRLIYVGLWFYMSTDVEVQKLRLLELEKLIVGTSVSGLRANQPMCWRSPSSEPRTLLASWSAWSVRTLSAEWSVLNQATASPASVARSTQLWTPSGEWSSRVRFSVTTTTQLAVYGEATDEMANCRVSTGPSLKQLPLRTLLSLCIYISVALPQRALDVVKSRTAGESSGVWRKTGVVKQHSYCATDSYNKRSLFETVWLGTFGSLASGVLNHAGMNSS
uniref:Uncharacterized protein n=1 Tax=Timema poppense TaxID=170557 RepID=A0A7R9D6V1_TIMPO|nr:unnamed protein product [Timema poppensis]